MRTWILLSLLALVLPGCDLFGSSCLYDAIGCDLPGDWSLVRVNTGSATGSLEVAEGFVDRDGYAALPTGNDTYPVMRGSYSGSYSVDPGTPQRFEIKLWRMDVDGGTVYADLYGRIDELDGDEMTYRITTVDAEILYNGGGTNPVDFPALQRGTTLLFER